MIKDLIVSLKSLVFLNENSTVNVNGHKAIKFFRYDSFVEIKHHGARKFNFTPFLLGAKRSKQSLSCD